MLHKFLARYRTHPMALSFLVIAAAMLLLSDSAAAMTYSVSVYSDGYGSGASAYLYGDIVDNSDTGGCTHSNYYTVSHLVSPTGRRADVGYSGYSATASLPVDNEVGDWDAYVTGTLSCSCAPGTPVGYGGQGPIITTFVANYQRTAVYSDHAVYHRCNVGDCWSMNVVRGGGYPAYLQLTVLKSSNGVTYECFAIGEMPEIPDCNAPIG